MRLFNDKQIILSYYHDHHYSRIIDCMSLFWIRFHIPIPFGTIRDVIIQLGINEKYIILHADLRRD